MTNTPATPAPEAASVAIDGHRVRRLRKLSGETVSTLAARCDITTQYLSLIERGDRLAVSAPVFARICDALNVQNRSELLREVA
jgi:transcriptional regulator with XRE-family HTH domain